MTAPSRADWRYRRLSRIRILLLLVLYEGLLIIGACTVFVRWMAVGVWSDEDGWLGLDEDRISFCEPDQPAEFLEVPISNRGLSAKLHIELLQTIGYTYWQCVRASLIDSDGNCLWSENGLGWRNSFSPKQLVFLLADGDGDGVCEVYSKQCHSPSSGEDAAADYSLFLNDSHPLWGNLRVSRLSHVEQTVPLIRGRFTLIRAMAWCVLRCQMVSIGEVGMVILGVMAYMLILYRVHLRCEQAKLLVQ